MMNCLINQLDVHLHNCKKFGENHYPTARTYFDQAFGMLLMACAYDPNNCAQYERLWNETYKPAFEKIVYKI